jgi:hypothetical protein
MILKEFSTKNKSSWGFNVHFECEYGEGQNTLITLLGDRRDNKSDWRWYLLQDLPWNMMRGREDAMKEGWFVGGHRRKGRLYVFDENCVVLLKLLTA